jgi:hypothetical protein
VEVFLNILYGFLATVALIAPIFLFGFLIAVLNRVFYRLCGKGSKTVCYATGFIGTPIHELSHASMCLLFGHKILEMKLYQIDADDGTLGYVRHSYNKKNLYHRIGNFFIGIAPIVIGSVLLAVLMFLMVRGLFGDVAGHVETFSLAMRGEAGGTGEAFGALFGIFGAYFWHAQNGFWWVYLLIASAIALHMNLSKSDISGSKEGLAAVLIVFLLFNIITGLVITPSAFAAMRGYILCGVVLLSLVLLQSLFLSGLWVLGALIVTAPKKIKAAVIRRKRLKAARPSLKPRGESPETVDGEADNPL